MSASATGSASTRTVFYISLRRGCCNHPQLKFMKPGGRRIEKSEVHQVRNRIRPIGGIRLQLKVPINPNNVTLRALRPASGGTRDRGGGVRLVRSCMSSELIPSSRRTLRYETSTFSAQQAQASRRKLSEEVAARKLRT